MPSRITVRSAPNEISRSIHSHRSERDAVECAIGDLTGSSRLLFFDELHVHDWS